MTAKLKFFKTGKEVKAAMLSRIRELEARLKMRNQALDAFMKDPVKVRSYLIFSTGYEVPYHGQDSPAALRSQTDISSEEEKEVGQLCRRIYEIEQEVHRLKMARAHLHDEQEIWLTMGDLQGYGFKVVAD